MTNMLDPIVGRRTLEVMFNHPNFARFQTVEELAEYLRVKIAPTIADRGN